MAGLQPGPGTCRKPPTLLCPRPVTTARPLFSPAKARLLAVLALCLTALWGAGRPAPLNGAQAVVVCGPDEKENLVMGAALGPGQEFRNSGHSILYLLLATGRLERVGPGAAYRIPAELGPRAWFFDQVSEALSDFRLRSARLDSVLARIYPGSEPPDTVEGTLVYPVGAALLEPPEAFKWQAYTGREAVFELSVECGEKPLLRTRLRADHLDRAAFDSLLVPGRLYRWSVGTEARADTGYFSLLEEKHLLSLSECLAVLDLLEGLDPHGGSGCGWLKVKTAVLCRLELYYEARAQVLARLKASGGERAASAVPPEKLHALLHQVRRLQRYGHLLRQRD